MWVTWARIKRRSTDLSDRARICVEPMALRSDVWHEQRILAAGEAAAVLVKEDRIEAHDPWQEIGKSSEVARYYSGDVIPLPGMVGLPARLARADVESAWPKMCRSLPAMPCFRNEPASPSL